MRDVVFIAGGPSQIYFVEYLREQFKVHVVNPERSPTVAAAHNWIQADILNNEKVIEGIRAEAPDPLFITSDQSDIATMPVALASQYFGTPANDPSVVRLFTNKYAMCVHAKISGLPVPEFADIGKVEQLRDWQRPFIIKPQNSTASRGFAVINENSDVEILYKRCEGYSRVLAQELVKGVEVTLEGICSNYEHVTLASSLKGHIRPGLATSLRYPSGIDEERLQELIAYNDTFVQESGLKFGITHSEYIVGTDQSWFIEIGCRGGGCGISSHIVPWVSGVNVYDILLSNLLEEPATITHLKPTRRPALLKFYEFQHGRDKGDLERISEEIKSLNTVNIWNFAFDENKYLKPADTDSDRHAMALMLAHADVDIDFHLQKIEEIFAREKLK